MIDIIIPAYNAHDTIMKTLYSISYQNIASFINVTIVNDCSIKDYSEEVKFFSNFIKINEIKLNKNSGPGVARQCGIDNTSNPYIIFIDSDDIFYDAFSVRYLFLNIFNSNYDVVNSSVYEEYDNKLEHLNKGNIWLHGNIYKRSFLNKYNIKFNDSRYNEDNGFNKLIELCNANIKYVEGYTYIWRFNKLSITRNKDNNYMLVSNKWLAYNINWSIFKAISIVGYNDKMSSVSYATLVSLFYHYLFFDCNDEILEWSRDLYLFYKEHILSKVDEKNIYNNQLFYLNDLDKLVNKYKINIDDFLDRIEGIL